MKIEKIIKQNKQYTLLKVEGNFEPYVVAWKFNGKDWCQGHYFDTLADAEKCYAEKTQESWDLFGQVLNGNTRRHYC